MNEYPASPQVTVKHPIPFTGEGTNDTDNINQVIHIKIVQDSNEYNLDAETLASKGAEDQYMPSWSCLIPKYALQD